MNLIHVHGGYVFQDHSKMTMSVCHKKNIISKTQRYIYIYTKLKLKVFKLLSHHCSMSRILSEGSVTAGSAAYAVEQRKHSANDPKCNELHVGRICIPLAVEHCRGSEAKQTLS